MNRMGTFRAGRYPRSLQTIAAEYTRIRIYRAKDVMYMRTYCRDMKNELDRMIKYKRVYRGQRAEIIRLRLLVRSLQQHRSNVIKLDQQESKLKEQKNLIASLQKNIDELRRSRCQMYRDWRDTHSKCSKLMHENDNLREEVEDSRNKNISVLREMSQFVNDFNELQTHLLSRINSYA